MDMLQKRGPEKRAEIKGEDYIIGFQRLSINDTTENGDQPFCSDDGNVILVCNGEIFNYKDLINRYELETKSSSDCEVILRLYEKGVFKASELNGDFAFVIFDKQSNTVVLGRDRIGVRPLFYGFTNTRSLVVSSEVKCMSLCEPYTICHVQPATTLSIKEKNGEQSYTQNLYYDLMSILPAQSDIKTLLIEATRKRLLSDRPIGCLLSGGLDSSVICAILCSLLGPKNVRTYSIGMEGSLDLRYAKKVAEYLGTNHTEVLFTPDEGLKAIPEVIYNLESYDITTVRASVGMYLLGRYISRNTTDKVIFSGEGSDELFCGYLYFHYAPSPEDAHKESLRLIGDLYKYDVLRADRCISCNGLELRVPFLDPFVLEYAKSLDPKLKAPNGSIEKKVIRDAFKGMLPDEVLYRRKDGFSDGVSGKAKPWFQHIVEHTGGKEGEWYIEIYNNYFGHYPKPIDYYWMPKWIECGNNPSGRVLSVFEK
jgi:asparagine synthase (glutamine-hydrolysing)